MLRRLTLAALLALAVPALFAGAAAAPLTRVPAAFRGHEVYLKVSLDGAAPVWMRFDVGADRSLLAGGARAARVTIGRTALETTRFASAPGFAGTAPDGAPLAGRLGEDCLGDRVLVIRAREHAVFLSPPIDTSTVPLPAPERARIASAAP